MGLYQLPDRLGGGTYPGRLCGCLDSETVELDMGDGSMMHLSAAAVTEVAPDEPPQGSIVFDADGDAWHHKDEFWWYGSRMVLWEQLCSERGPLTPYGQAPSQPVEGLPIRTDLVSGLPAEFWDAAGRRRLIVDEGKRTGQLLFQGAEGDAFSRTVILERDEALALAWTVLVAVSS